MNFGEAYKVTLLSILGAGFMYGTSALMRDENAGDAKIEATFAKQGKAKIWLRIVADETGVHFEKTLVPVKIIDVLYQALNKPDAEEVIKAELRKGPIYFEIKEEGCRPILIPAGQELLSTLFQEMKKAKEENHLPANTVDSARANSRTPAVPTRTT